MLDFSVKKIYEKDKILLTGSKAAARVSAGGSDMLSMNLSTKDCWDAAKGLQSVDWLETTPYLEELIFQDMNGEINTLFAHRKIKAYYAELKAGNVMFDNSDAFLAREADVAAAAIASILPGFAFSFSVSGLFAIHAEIFNGIFTHPGMARTCNIVKREEQVLNGDTVIYAPYAEIAASLAYDFEREKYFDYTKSCIHGQIEHMARFIAAVWQIHPFGDGNTRTIAVFLVKYLQYLGFPVNIRPFAKHSRYFRNALVRANYNNIPLGIREDYSFLEKFLSNMINKTAYDLPESELEISVTSS